MLQHVRHFLLRWLVLQKSFLAFVCTALAGAIDHPADADADADADGDAAAAARSDQHQHFLVYAANVLDQSRLWDNFREGSQ